jgi:hypothetical protein
MSVRGVFSRQGTDHYQTLSENGSDEAIERLMPVSTRLVMAVAESLVCVWKAQGDRRLPDAISFDVHVSPTMMMSDRQVWAGPVGEGQIFRFYGSVGFAFAQYSSGHDGNDIFSVELMRFIRAYKVVDLPLPVGPVTRTMPLREKASP